jgi:hypothetical protein
MKRFIVNSDKNYNNAILSIIFEEKEVKYEKDLYTDNIEKAKKYFLEKIEFYFRNGLENLLSLYSNFLNRLLFNI